MKFRGASKQHRYYRSCPFCGSALDPGERCDCKRSQRFTMGEEIEKRMKEDKTA